MAFLLLWFQLSSYDPEIRSTIALTIHQIVRGHADVQPGSRGVIVAQQGGNTWQIPLPGSDSSDKSYKHDVTSTLPKGARYQATFFLLLERDADKPEFGGDISVESLDIEIQPPRGKVIASLKTVRKTVPGKPTSGLGDPRSRLLTVKAGHCREADHRFPDSEVSRTGPLAPDLKAETDDANGVEGSWA
jgi:hypothetical protein